MAAALALIGMASMLFAGMAIAAVPVLTPIERYSDPAWKAKAQKHEPALKRLHQNLKKQFPDSMSVLSAGESAVGGIGFWPRPIGQPQDGRFLGVFAKVNCPPRPGGPPFPDTPEGRVFKMIHAYGKDTIKHMAAEIGGINDPDLKGGVMVFIHCETEGAKDPYRDAKAEAFAIYMPRDEILKFASFRMTLQDMLSKSTVLPIFQGPEDIKNLRTFVIQP